MRFLLLLPLVALAGCNVWQTRAEFAPPESRWPSTLPSPVAAEAPPPAVRVLYCYRTLGTVDCLPAPVAGRPGFVGTYP